MLCRYSTILDLCWGSTRENRRARAQAARCSDTDRSSNSRPEYDLPVVSSSSVNTPIRLEKRNTKLVIFQIRRTI